MWGRVYILAMNTLKMHVNLNQENRKNLWKKNLSRLKGELEEDEMDMCNLMCEFVYLYTIIKIKLY
jgi:hypothetical protein